MVEHLKQRGTQLEHLESFPVPLSPRSQFDRALLTYLGLRPRSGIDGLRDGRRRAMLKALDDRATWPQIREWRRGRATAPKWAADLINEKIDARTKELLAARAA